MSFDFSLCVIDYKKKKSLINMIMIKCLYYELNSYKIYQSVKMYPEIY